MRDDVERSESGSPIYRYGEVEGSGAGFRPPTMDEESLTLIEEHIYRHIGDGEGNSVVWHEIVSDLVHIDVHVIPPTKRRNYYTLVTTGMSDIPMNAPPEAGDVGYAELLLCLPPEWPLLNEQKLTTNEEYYWPIHVLKFLARFPHLYDTWLGFGHTIPNGDPPSPFSRNTRLCCALILSPLLFGEEFPELTVRDDKTVHFYSVVPIYKEEMDLKLKKGSSALVALFDEHGVTELLDVNRKNVCTARRRWFH